MLLGLVATNENAQVHLLGLASAAKARGWQCRCFLTDLGVRLLHSDVLDLAVCEHSWVIYGSGQAPAGVVMASQFQNAELAHLCDKVIVL
jgi:peroxiredoxin family protein